MYANVNEVKIFYETFGASEHSPILLIMGAGSQGILWSDNFCKALANHGFYVIRYDHRDTGFSTCIDYEKNPYTLDDLAQDALGLLDHLNIFKANMVGLSMGGYLVQLIVISHPERLITETLIMTTPNHMILMKALAGEDIPSNLPKPKKEVLEFFATPPTNIDTPDGVIDYSVQTWKLLNGSKVYFDEAYWRSLVTKHYNRTRDHVAQFNHGKACFATPEDRTMLLKKVDIPTLIIHGSEDPMLPIAHGRALLDTIPKSELLIIENMGHALNEIFHDEITSAITNFIHAHNPL